MKKFDYRENELYLYNEEFEQSSTKKDVIMIIESNQKSKIAKIILTGKMFVIDWGILDYYIIDKLT